MTDPEKDLAEEPEVSSTDNDTEGTAPDSETQSSAASADGDRTADGGSRAPNAPAEGE